MSESIPTPPVAPPPVGLNPAQSAWLTGVLGEGAYS